MESEHLVRVRRKAEASGKVREKTEIGKGGKKDGLSQAGKAYDPSIVEGRQGGGENRARKRS